MIRENRVSSSREQGQRAGDLDVCGICEEHRHAVDAHAPAAGRWQAALQRLAEVLIEHLSLVVATGLRSEEVSRKHKWLESEEGGGGKETLSLACPANISR